MKNKIKIVLVITALLVVSTGQYIIAQSCFVMDTLETSAVFGAESIPDCDCANVTDGTLCEKAYPPSCTLASQCKRCYDTHKDETCNDPDPWDWSDCVIDSDHPCKGYWQGVCDGLGNCTDAGGSNHSASACPGSSVVEQCHN